MAESYGELPILYALGADGVLHFVDDVDNGAACDCSCPDPACGQPLVARNAGMRRIHHFAHRQGGCAWSVDNVVTRLAADAVASSGKMAFPQLSYRNHLTGEDVEISKPLLLRVSEARLESLSGRGAPEIIVTYEARDGNTRKFVVVVPLTHRLTDIQVAEISRRGYKDVVVVDLRTAMAARKGELGRHYDRFQLVAEFQDRACVERAMLDTGWRFSQWKLNARREQLEAESREERERIDAERREAERIREQKRAEAVRLEREEWERRRRKQEEQAKLIRRRREEEQEKAAQEQRRIERYLSPEGWEEGKAYVLPLLESQTAVARDQIGRRWCRCELCGRVDTEDEFTTMGGAGRINLGKCRSCMMGR